MLLRVISCLFGKLRSHFLKFIEGYGQGASFVAWNRHYQRLTTWLFPKNNVRIQSRHPMDNFDLLGGLLVHFLNSSRQTGRGILRVPYVAIQGRRVHFEGQFPKDDGTRECVVRVYGKESRVCECLSLQRVISVNEWMVRTSHTYRWMA